MLMVMYTMENLKMTRLMGMESMTTSMVPAMMDTGPKTSNMDMERKLGMIMPVTKVSTKMEKSTGKVNSYGLTDRSTPESFPKTIYMVMVFTNGPTGANIPVNGKTTKWTVKVSSLGLTEEITKDSTLTIKKRDMEYLHGPMVVSTMEIGEMGSSMGLERILLAMEKLRKVNGLMVSELSGLKRAISETTIYLKSRKMICCHKHLMPSTRNVT